ncbi:uncharacterized protein [Parasteatoda tepidariorum]|nr:myosin light chain kinase, smooth muscle isoform X1 [Parasteatoda tepidariorum]XP_042897176.1 myosin light chain kinase, smooth muscle isoform X1 [Parasteatoda tepidariorum]
MSLMKSPRRSLKATAPRFLQPLSVKDEEDVRTLECRVDGYPRPDIFWEKSGRAVGKSRRIHMTRSGDRCLLQIKMPQLEDNGLYSCIATNNVGRASTQMKVSSPFSSSRRMNGASLRLNSTKINGIQARILEFSTLERAGESFVAQSETGRIMFRKRSQSGGAKTRQDNLSLPSKPKQPTFTSHIIKNSNDKVSNPPTTNGNVENSINLEKKRLCKSMEDCRKVKKSFFNRVKIPDIFNSSQNYENKSSSLRSHVLQPSQKVNGVFKSHRTNCTDASQKYLFTSSVNLSINIENQDLQKDNDGNHERTSKNDRQEDLAQNIARTIKDGSNEIISDSDTCSNNSCQNSIENKEYRNDTGTYNNSSSKLESEFNQSPRSLKSKTINNELLNCVNATTNSDCIETPTPLTTRERIAAYLKKFETSNSSKSKDLTSDKINKSAKSKEYGRSSLKTPAPTENDSKFFSFSKFKRRKSSSDANKKNSITEIPNTISEMEDHPQATTCLENYEKEPSIKLPFQTKDTIFIDHNSSVPGHPEDKRLVKGDVSECVTEGNAESEPGNVCLEEIDLSSLTFDRIDVSLLEELDPFQTVAQERMHLTADNEDKSKETLSDASEISIEKDDIKIEVPSIKIEVSAEDNEEDNEMREDNEEIVNSNQDLSKYSKGRITSEAALVNKLSRGIWHTSPSIEEECEAVFDKCEEIHPPEILETDQQAELSLEASPARIVKGPQSVTVLRGESVTLAISFTGSPSPQVIWMKGGRILTSNGRLSILDGREMSVVTVNEVTADDSGKYVVSVENEGGGDSCFASVAVVGFPEPPGGEPTANEVTDHSLVLSWYGSMYDGGSVVTGYQVEMCTLPSKTWQKVVSSVNTSCSVQGLSKGQRYVFRVRAENRYGLSHPSKESKVICLDDFLMDSSSDEELTEEKPAEITVDNGTEFSDRFDIKEEVGKGRFGTVYRCVEKSCGRPRAAKIIRCLKIKDKEKVKQEIEIMSRLHHPKLMQVLAAFESGRNMIMVMEYISGGELFERVIADDFILTEQDCVLFMRQICDGVSYMHRNNVIHLDLKPENILCKTRTSHKIKIIDFGLARFYKSEESLRVLFGTPEFVAPEVINYEPVCPSSDMWSVGVICYVLISGLSPFMGESDTETFANITRGEMDFDDEAFDDISEDAKDFISKLLVKRVKARMSAEECLKHSWLATATSVQKRPLSTEKLKRFIIRRKWQKSGTAIRALGRMVSLSRSSIGSSCDSPLGSPISSRSGSSRISRSETAESGESDIFQDLSR